MPINAVDEDKINLFVSMSHRHVRIQEEFLAVRLI